MKQRLKADTVAGLFFLLVGVVIIYLSASLPAARMTRFGSGFFPTITGYGLLISSIIMIVSSIRNAVDERKPFIDKTAVPRLLLLAMAIVIYSLLLRPIGYIIATILFLMAVLYIFGYRKYLWLVVISVVMPLIIYYLFVELLGVPLP